MELNKGIVVRRHMPDRKGERFLQRIITKLGLSFYRPQNILDGEMIGLACITMSYLFLIRVFLKRET
jgi:hypothetical protein